MCCSINVNIPSGSLVAVVGQVGCGKTTLLSAFLGETERLSGKVYVKVSQLSLKLTIVSGPRPQVSISVRNGAKCNLRKVKLATMQSAVSPLAVHDERGCPKDLAGLDFGSCCSRISRRQNFAVLSPSRPGESLRIHAHAVS